MDLFYDTLDVKEKKRIHFNEFMLDIQKQIHFFKTKQHENPIASVAKENAKTRVLCLDEF